MKKEFNLSNRILDNGTYEHLHKEDIQEFIKRLKEITKYWISTDEFEEWEKQIDKLVGDDLTNVS